MPSPNSHCQEFSHAKCEHTNLARPSQVRITRKSPWKALEPLNSTRGAVLMLPEAGGHLSPPLLTLCCY